MDIHSHIYLLINDTCDQCNGVTIIALNSTNKCDVAPSSNLHNVHLTQKSPTVKKAFKKLCFYKA